MKHRISILCVDADIFAQYFWSALFCGKCGKCNQLESSHSYGGIHMYPAVNLQGPLVTKLPKPNPQRLFAQYSLKSSILVGSGLNVFLNLSEEWDAESINFWSTVLIPSITRALPPPRFAFALHRCIWHRVSRDSSIQVRWPLAGGQIIDCQVKNNAKETDFRVDLSI